jgi:hypothetical protein
MLEYQYSLKVDVFDLDGVEYHFTGSTWNRVYGESVESVLNPLEENRLNQLYAEWQKTKDTKSISELIAKRDGYKKEQEQTRAEIARLDKELEDLN